MNFANFYEILHAILNKALGNISNEKFIGRCFCIIVYFKNHGVSQKFKFTLIYFLLSSHIVHFGIMMSTE